MRNSIFILLGFALASCSSSTRERGIETLEQMTGSWKANGIELTEEWKQNEDGSFHADVFNHEGWEPELIEYIDVVQEGEDLYFIGTILKQNSGLPIRFRLVEAKDDKVTFENAAHDFPQYISYQIMGPDKLKAMISGSQNGKYREQGFIYYRSMDTP